MLSKGKEARSMISVSHGELKTVEGGCIEEVIHPVSAPHQLRIRPSSERMGEITDRPTENLDDFQLL